MRVSLKTGACLETFVQYNLYEFFSQDGTVTVPLDARDVRSVRLTFEDSCRGQTVTDITVNAQPDGFSFNLGRYLLLFFVAALLILIFRLRLGASDTVPICPTAGRCCFLSRRCC